MRRLLRVILHHVMPLVLAGRAVYRRVTRPVTVGVRALIVQDGQVLLVRAHGSSLWELPGGGVERGEALREAAVREAHEETGCVIASDYLLGIYFDQYQGMSNHIAVYVCQADTAPALSFNLEIAAVRFWPLDVLPQSTPATLHRRLAEYKAGKQGIDGIW
jgi:ADP-ribose pyrophosphatase YjhB (NUDIX family)